jgi:hypothetical protein
VKRVLIALPMLLAAGALAAGCAAEDTSGDASSSSSSASTKTSSKKKTVTCDSSKRCDQRLVVRRVKNGQVKLGMTKSQVRAKVGRPSDASNSSTQLPSIAGGNETMSTSIWTYSPKLADYGDLQTVVLQFTNGKLDSKSTV